MDTGATGCRGPQANYEGYNPTARPATGATGTTPLPAPLPRRRPTATAAHTLGTAVGGEGIGVAPGARWIAVKVLNRDGYGYDSWITPDSSGSWPRRPSRPWPRRRQLLLGGRERLLHRIPAGPCALRRRGSSSSSPTATAARAGDGLSRPPSTEAFAVDAHGRRRRVAYFSSRGPSPWGEVRPRRRRASGPLRPPRRHLRHYERHLHGDPHVAGLAALLRAVSPTVDITRTAFLITSTAVPLSTTLPNNDSGWEADRRFRRRRRSDERRGGAGDGHPFRGRGTIPGATVSATFHGDGGGGLATTGASGRYTLPLAPGPYDLTARAFGYAPSTRYGVIVTAGATVTADFALTALPTGAPPGRPGRRRPPAPVTATVSVLDTPLTATASLATFALPEGSYIVHARAVGYRVVTATASVAAEEDDGPHPDPPPAPSILLVDSGAWYYGSQIAYYRQALDDLALAYDEWTVRQIPDDTPTADLLAPTTWWSGARRTTPRPHRRAERHHHLPLGGGRLLLSGQDVGFLGAGMPYYWKYLKNAAGGGFQQPLDGGGAPRRPLRRPDDHHRQGRAGQITRPTPTSSPPPTRARRPPSWPTRPARGPGANRSASPARPPPGADAP